MRIVSIARRSVLTLALLAALPAVAQTAPAAGMLAKLASTKTITLGVRRDAAPFSYLDAAGKPGGFSWALCQAIVQQLSSDLKTPLQVKFEPVTLVESFERLGDGRIDLHCGSTANTVERAERVAFSNTFFVSRVVAAHRAQDAKFASAREYGRTGVLQGCRRCFERSGARRAPQISPSAFIARCTAGRAPTRSRYATRLAKGDRSICSGLAQLVTVNR